MKNSILKNFKTDFRSILFFGIIITIIAIAFTSKGIGRFSRPQDGMLLIEELFKYPKADLLQHGFDSYSSVSVFEHIVRYTFLYLILPLTGAISALRFCDETNTGNLKFLIIRQGKNNYIFGRIFSCMITSFSACFIGLSIVFLILYAVLPTISDCAQIAAGYGQELLCQSAWFKDLFVSYDGFAYALLRILFVSIMAVPCGLFTLLASVIFKNKFLSISLPILFFVSIERFSMTFRNILTDVLNFANLTTPDLSGYYSNNILTYSLVVLMLIIIPIMLIYVLFEKAVGQNEY